MTRNIGPIQIANQWRKMAERAISALKVIDTWATFRDGEALAPLDVHLLCQRALQEIEDIKTKLME